MHQDCTNVTHGALRSVAIFLGAIYSALGMHTICFNKLQGLSEVSCVVVACLLSLLYNMSPDEFPVSNHPEASRMEQKPFAVYARYATIWEFRATFFQWHLRICRLTSTVGEF